MPIAGYATLEGDTITLQGLVASVDGKTILKSTLSRSSGEAEALGIAVADALLKQGAGPLLAALSEETDLK